ncbi:MAG: glycoside hydrolase family 127 protein [Clostridia bacterium]|nr:glycoside hydrolase family 127 protein [Clostridia bacterium]
MKYTAYENRKKTDVFACPEMGAGTYAGQVADSIAYIEQAQLLDPALWSLFVEQFRIGDVDDWNLGWRCEFWGKMMRGACFTYAYTQNETLYRVLEDTVRDILSTEDKYGRIASYSVTKEFHGWDIWGRKYVLLGMQYFLEICRDNNLADAVVASMCRQVDYLCAKIGNGEVGKLPITNTSEWWEGLNASSILEPIVRLYNLTNNQKYLDFAKGIIDAGGLRSFNIFEAALEGKKYPYEYPVTKAYEMISNFEGIIEYYRVTGDEKYKTMAVNFARLVIDSDITVIGSAGTTHELFDHSKVRQFNPAFDGIMQETCVTVTWMKFCWQLLCLTGDAMYADQMERSIYNGLMGAINVNKHICKNQVFTFDSYSPLLNNVRGRQVGGRMDIIRDRFWWGCCVAIGAAGTGLSAMTANMQAKDGVVVNFYMPGDYRQAVGASAVSLHMDTAYPVEGTAKITVSTDSRDAFAIYLRIPAWSRETAVTVNGEAVSVTAGTYAKLERSWKTGDVIDICFDMRTQIIYAADIDPRADAASICHCALQRGPVMLARDSQLGETVSEAVTIVDNGGYASVTSSSTANFPVKQEYKVKTTDGEITVVDYPSAGQNWNPDMPITVWITTK